MQLEQTEIYAEMDPRLQRIVDRRSRGLRTVATASSGADEISVIARVTDLDAWSARTDVRVGARLGQADGEWLVTARLPMARIEEVRRAEPVRSLKPAQPLRPLLQATVEEIEASPDVLPAGGQAGGAGAVVGIVDCGADVAHRNFRSADGSTRLRALWDQSGG